MECRNGPEKTMPHKIWLLMHPSLQHPSNTLSKSHYAKENWIHQPGWTYDSMQFPQRRDSKRLIVSEHLHNQCECLPEI